MCSNTYIPMIYRCVINLHGLPGLLHIIIVAIKKAQHGTLSAVRCSHNVNRQWILNASSSFLASASQMDSVDPTRQSLSPIARSTS
jgi:hypothetical protein